MHIYNYENLNFIIKYLHTSLFIVLFTKEPPQLANLSLSTDLSNVGDYVQLTCIVTKGDLPIHLEWSLNNKNIIAELPFTTVASVGSHTSLLMINNVTAQHAGQYLCRAYNHAGSFNRTKQLIVNGRLLDFYFLLEKGKWFFDNQAISCLITFFSTFF